MVRVSPHLTQPHSGWWITPPSIRLPGIVLQMFTPPCPTLISAQGPSAPASSAQDLRTWKLETSSQLVSPSSGLLGNTFYMLTTLRYIFSPRLPPLPRLPVCSSSMSKRHPSVKHLTKAPHGCCITASPTRLEVSS